MSPEELGRQLRRARQHMGLSLPDVQAVTAIPLPCLAALEEGRLDQLPSPVYARGYVRSYAEAVRLDGDRLALELWRLMEEARVAATAADRQPRARARRTPSPLARLRQPESPWVPKPGRLQRVLPGMERAAILVLLVVLAVAVWSLGQGGHGKRKPQVAAFNQLRPPEPGQSPAATPAPPAPTPSPSQSASILRPVSDNGSLATYAIGKDRFDVVVKATDAPCWVDVRSAAGGVSLFQGTLSAGEDHPLPGQGPVRIRVGDVGHAAITVDGIPLTLPDRPSLPYNLVIQR